MSIPFSTGALYSTTEDLLRWEQGLFGGKLLSKESLSKMTTPYKGNYALGLMIGTDNGHRVIQHGGGIQGFVTHLAYYPDDKITVAVLSNVMGTAPPGLAVKLAAVARGEKALLPDERKEITVPAEILSQYVGTYELTPKINIIKATVPPNTTATLIVLCSDENLLTVLMGDKKCKITKREGKYVYDIGPGKYEFTVMK